MRYIYSLLIVIFISSTSWGQTFTLPELVKIVKMNEKDFVALVKNKGFSASKMTDKGDFEKSMNFVIRNSVGENKSISWSSYMFGESIDVRFATENIDDFVFIENQVSKLNLKVKVTKKDKWGNGVEYSFVTYFFEEYLVSLWKEGGGFSVSVSLWNK